MDRRSFIGTLVGGLLAASLAVQAQQAAKIARIGLLGNDPVGGAHLLEAFRQGLRDLGHNRWPEHLIEYR